MIMAHLKVITIKNSPVDSNCYLVFDPNSKKAIIIDPGTSGNGDAETIIDDQKLCLDYIILTHEHFDHIAGVNKIKNMYNCKIVCSASCSDKITNRKKNLSIFYDQVGFECSPADIVFVDRMNLKWNDYKIILLQAKGHSEGGMIIKIENLLFTGDTVIKGKKTVLKLPDSNMDDLIRSINLISTFLDEKTLIYPGHGESFGIKEFNQAHYF